MAPRPRKRARRSPTPIYESESEPESDEGASSEYEFATNNAHSPTPIVLSTTGLLALPPELISQILSYFAVINTEYLMLGSSDVRGWDDSDSEDFLVRFDVLRSLSQLSRLSRTKFLPLLWERFQVCLSPKPEADVSWYHHIGGVLERKSKGLLDSDYLWSYIKIVTVVITQHKAPEAIPPFVKLLKVLPNVNTLEVLHSRSMMAHSLKKYFEGSIFPSIQRAVLPTPSHEILRCCPRVREVTCNWGDGGRLIDALVHVGCPKLEILRRVTANSAVKFSKRLRKAKSSPPMKCVRLDGRFKESLTENAISALSVFPYLRIIEIEANEGEELDRVVKFASDTIRKCAEHTKDTKNWNLRESTKNTRLMYPRSANHGPGLVRLLRFKRFIYSQTLTNFIPLKIEEYPVEI